MLQAVAVVLINTEIQVEEIDGRTFEIAVGIIQQVVIILTIA